MRIIRTISDEFSSLLHVACFSNTVIHTISNISFFHPLFILIGFGELCCTWIAVWITKVPLTLQQQTLLCKTWVFLLFMVQRCQNTHTQTKKKVWQTSKKVDSSAKHTSTPLLKWDTAELSTSRYVPHMFQEIYRQISAVFSSKGWSQKIIWLWPH